MKLWIDDVRPAPNGYVWCKSVNEAKSFIIEHFIHIELISLDHDAGNFALDGGDYINILNYLEWLENVNYDFNVSNINFHLHSMNPVGVQNMRAIIQRNGWEEV